MQETMRCPVFAAALVAAGICAACSGAPKDDAPDYEVDITSARKGADGDQTTSTGSDTSASTTTPAEPTTNTAETGTGGSGAGSGTGTGTGTGTGATPPPQPTKVTVKIGGQDVPVVGTTLWSDVPKAGNFTLFVKVKGSGVPDGSDFVLDVIANKSGCQPTVNWLTYRPANDTQYMPGSQNDPTCGLTVTALPNAVGGRLKATFNGTLTAIDGTSKTKAVMLSVDFLREN
jgi:hypothetical protein